MYHCNLDNLYLIPTAEVPVTNLYRDVILDQKELPKMNCAYSACFRREAGSYGKDVRGLNRLHQFDKVEIVRIEKPENSYAALEMMKDHVQGLLEKLELPWHILRLCGGDMSFTSAITFDFEVYSAAQKRWLEVSSVSNFESYQANRLKCRYRGDDKKTHLCHTLNGSALALPRIMAASVPRVSAFRNACNVTLASTSSTDLEQFLVVIYSQVGLSRFPWQSHLVYYCIVVNVGCFVVILLLWAVFLPMQVVTLQKKILVELCVADVLHYLYTNDK